MDAALNGNLKDFGIADVFQLIGQQRKTGVLQVSNRPRTLRIAFDQGAIVQAWWGGPREHEALAEMLVRCGLVIRERVNQLARESLESARAFQAAAVESGDVRAEEMEEIVDLLTQEVVFEVIRWKKGSFHFSAQTFEHDRTPDRMLAAEQILMDGLRMVDEWAGFADWVPNEEIVFAPAGSFELYRQQARGTDRENLATAERVFQLVDGRLSARRIIDLARIGTFDGTRLLASLRAAGAIEAAHLDASPRKGRLARPTIGSALASMRVVLVSALPLALLAASLWLSANTVSMKRVVPGVAIAPRPLERAVASFEARGVRHALEAHRYLWKQWPDRLEEVERMGWDVPDTLAAPDGRPYYYSKLGDGVLLLAPER